MTRPSPRWRHANIAPAERAVIPPMMKVRAPGTSNRRSVRREQYGSWSRAACWSGGRAGGLVARAIVARPATGRLVASVRLGLGVVGEPLRRRTVLAPQRPHLGRALELDGDVPRHAAGSGLAPEAARPSAGRARGPWPRGLPARAPRARRRSSSYAAQARPSATARSPSTSSPKRPMRRGGLAARRPG